jgi:uncharacterized protein (TIGR02145 family)
MPSATYTLQASALAFCAGLVNVQFALSGTEAGRSYQLFRNNSAVGALLNGTGSAATFTGSFNAAGTYTAQSVADELYCATAMSGTPMVIENLLPANPAVTGASRHCSGTVTLSASSNGALIDWYADAAGTTTLHTGASYTTPEIDESTTYYVQARIENTGCVSAARVAVSAEVITEGCCQAPGSTVTFTAFAPCSGVATGATWTLTDSRDNKMYKVRLMEDGHVWMVQDLAFGQCSGTTYWYNDNSFAATTHNPTVAPSYVGHCVAHSDTQRGYYYSWPAALNSQYAYYGSTYTFCAGTASGTVSPNPGYCQGICPTGWHVPTGASAGEYSNLSERSGCTAQGCYYQSDWFASKGGGLATPNGAFPKHDSEDYLWSSSGSGDSAYALTSHDYKIWWGTELFAQNYAFRLRCLRNY